MKWVFAFQCSSLAAFAVPTLQLAYRSESLGSACACAVSLLTLIMNINSQHSAEGTAVKHLALSSTSVFLSHLCALLSLGTVAFY